MSHEVDGSHAAISAQLARRCGESDGVVHAIEAHHYDVQPQTVESVLLIAADAISARRRELVARASNYIRRLEALEEIATAKDGVAKAYALQAGREIRVIVEPAEIDDDGAILLSRIAREIKDQLEYPGQVEGHRHPREPRDRGGEVDARDVARRWAAIWPGVAAADVDAIAALYAQDAVFYSHPFRDRQGPAEYAAWAFADQALLSAARRASRGRTASSGRLVGRRHCQERSVQSLAGTSLLRFDAAGLVVEQRDAWAETAARADDLGAPAVEPETRPYNSTLMRRYHVTTFGCQMNAHDSERIKGMLESLGLGEASAPEEADVVVFNACTIRESPTRVLAAYLGNAGA